MNTITAAAFVILAQHPTGADHWYPRDCCSGRDCKPIACDLLSEQRDGSILDTTTGARYSHTTIRPSEDNSCHVCHNGKPLCVFILQGS